MMEDRWGGGGDDIYIQLSDLGCTSDPCGSRVTCNPAPTDSDYDFLIVVPRGEAGENGMDKNVSEVVKILHNNDFKWEGGEHYQQLVGSDFMSFRRGQLNLIVTSNQFFAQRHRAATYVCQHLNLMKKQDRVMVFQAVLYGARFHDMPQDTIQ